MELRKKARDDYASLDSGIESLTVKPTGIVYEAHYIYRGCRYSILVADSRISGAGKGLYLATLSQALVMGWAKPNSEIFFSVSR